MLRPRASSLLGRTHKSSSLNSLHTLTTLIRSVAYVSLRNSYLVGDCIAFSSTPHRAENKVTHGSRICKSRAAHCRINRRTQLPVLFAPSQMIDEHLLDGLVKCDEHVADRASANEMADFLGDILGVIPGALQRLRHKDDLQTGLPLQVLGIFNVA